jgi:hypothetical protein
MSGKRQGLKLQIQEIWNKKLDEWQLDQLKINA